MIILQVIFQAYNCSQGQFADAVLFIRESEFTASNVYHIAERHSHIVCSAFEIDKLIEKRCLNDAPEIIHAHETAMRQGAYLKLFPSVGSLNMNPFIVPLIGEADFVAAVERMGGRKIPETTTMTPDFQIGSVVIELKDLQMEGLSNKERQKSIARLFESISARTIDLRQLLHIEPFEANYQKLIANTIKNQVKKASTQVKTYSSSHTVNSAGIAILNTGMFSLEHERLKSIVENILRNNTSTISFSLLFTQKMQTNGLDTYATFACEFVGDIPSGMEGLRSEINSAVERRMTQMMVMPHVDIAPDGVKSMRPISFLADDKIFFWNPGKVTGNLTAGFESRQNLVGSSLFRMLR